MLNLQDIAQSLKVKREGGSFNKDIFKSDFSYLDDANEIREIVDMNAIKVYEQTENNGSMTIKAIAPDSEYKIVYNVVIKEQPFGNEINTSVSIQELTLQGMNYLTKERLFPEDLQEEYNIFLRESGIDAETQDLFTLAELNTEYDVFMVQFDTDEYKYWITFKGENHLTKITRRANDKSVSAKVDQRTEIQRSSLVKSLLG